MMIDIHTHMGRVWDGYEELTADEMLRWMDEHGIEKAVLLPLESPEATSYYVLTEDVLSTARKHPDRFIPFCSVDPRMSTSRGRDSLRDMVARYVELGARGFGELKAGLAIDDPLMQELYSICEELGLCVLFHMDGVRCYDKPGLSALERMLKAFPGVNFIGYATGFWSHISGEVSSEDMNTYPKIPIKPGGRLDDLLSAYPNLYGDLSAGSGYNAIARDPEAGRLFIERHRAKLFFGTDKLTPDQEIQQFRWPGEIGLSSEVWESISCGNALRLLRL